MKVAGIQATDPVRAKMCLSDCLSYAFVQQQQNQGLKKEWKECSLLIEYTYVQYTIIIGTGDK
jgi:hypothetical protein